MNFWDKSRASLTARLGRRDVAHTIVQNFRQKICFRTEDTQTLQWLSDCLSTAEVKRRVQSQTHSATPGRDKTYTQSIHYSREPVLPPSIIRELGPDETVAILSIQSQSCDDVLTCQPLYLEASSPPSAPQIPSGTTKPPDHPKRTAAPDSGTKHSPEAG